MLYQEKTLEILSNEELEALKKELDDRYKELNNRREIMYKAIDEVNRNEPDIFKQLPSNSHIRKIVREMHRGILELDEEIHDYIFNMIAIDEIIESRIEV